MGPSVHAVARRVVAVDHDNLDSDDGLEIRFVETVQGIVMDRMASPGAPPILVLGFHEVRFWDLHRSWTAPFGWSCRRRRSGRLFSPGFSLAARWPQYPVLVTGARHLIANAMLDFEVDDPAADAPYSLRRHACELARRHGEDLLSWPIDATLLMLDGRLRPLLMLNHEDTVTKRAGGKSDGKRVWGRRTFDDVPLEWSRMWSRKGRPPA